MDMFPVLCSEVQESLSDKCDIWANSWKKWWNKPCRQRKVKLYLTYSYFLRCKSWSQISDLNIMIGAVDLIETQLLSICPQTTKSSHTSQYILQLLCEISLWLRRKRGSSQWLLWPLPKILNGDMTLYFLYTKFWAPVNGLMDLVTSGIWNQIHMGKIDLETTE